jgi:hypothetical protein
MKTQVVGDEATVKVSSLSPFGALTAFIKPGTRTSIFEAGEISRNPGNTGDLCP